LNHTKLFPFLLLGLISVAACGPKWKDYRSPKGPFLKVPETWQKVDNLVDYGDLQFQDEEHRRYFIVYSEDRAGLVRNTLERYSKFVREGIRDGVRLPESVGPKNLTLGGMRAIQYEIGGTVGDEKFYYLHTTVEGKTQFHQLIGWSPASLKAENWPLLEKITESFGE
jgi:hypothetical protein